MKRYTSLFFAMLFTTSWSVAQEIDDMYFFKTDRERPKKATLDLPMASARPDFSENEVGEAFVADKFANPDFNGNVAASNDLTYVEEGRILTQYSEPNRGLAQNTNRFGNRGGWGRPRVNMGFGTGTWGSWSSLAVSFGSGAMMNPWGWNSPWGMNNRFGWNDPWAWNSPWGWNDPWAWGGNRWNRWGANRPIVIVNNYDTRPTRTVRSVRTYTGARATSNNRNLVQRGNSSARSTQYSQRVSQLSDRHNRGYTTSSNNARGTSRSYNSRNYTNRSSSRSYNNSSRSSGNQRNWNHTPSRSSSNRSSFSSPSRSSGSRSTGGSRSVGRSRSGRN